MNDIKKELYELGYLIPGTVAEGDAANIVSAIKDIITKKGGEMTHESAPKLRKLAYQIARKLESKREWFEQAYFGWIAFSAPADAVNEINEAVRFNKEVLRFITIKTTQEAVEYRLKREEEGDLEDEASEQGDEAVEVIEEEKPEVAKEEETKED